MIRSRILSKVLAVFIVSIALVAAGLAQSTRTVSAQGGVSPNTCYSVADLGDRLHTMDRFTGTNSAFPNGTGIQSIEGIELSIDKTQLWAINDDTPSGTGTFGVLDQTTGVFSAIGSIGTAAHSILGDRNVGDGDAMSIDSRTNKLWAIEQTGGTLQQAIYRVDPATGSHVNDIFGTGNDYAIVDLRPASMPACSAGGPTCTAGVNCPTALDDLGIHPETGEFFAIANDISGVTVDWLIKINIDGTDAANSPGYDASTGYVSACTVGIVNDGTDNVTDMEGFGVFNDGTFYGTTGNESTIAAQRDTMWRIDVSNAQATRIGTFDTDNDYESVSCLTGGANEVTGTVFCEAPTNKDGIYNTGDTAQQGATLRLYLDRGTPNTLDASDILLQTTATDASGNYRFMLGLADNFLVEVDSSIVPAGSSMTTSTVFDADFASGTFGSTDAGNNFGFECSPGPQVSPTAQPQVSDPALSKVGLLTRGQFGLPGEQITWQITATNPTSNTLTNVVIIDDVRADLRIDNATTSTGTVDINGQVVTFDIGDMAPGARVDMTIVTTIMETALRPITNLATLYDSSGVRATDSAVVPGTADPLPSLPSTGYPPQ